ncbi:methionine aminotransferase [Pseudoalteromonas luteoviolacea]|uniref:Aminotransferase n=1 Tax=Pseudoalteromonas luteoviolacea H33 TaxID=1365251 RepID=A0A167GRH0_9GAMM|nr:methionine aminotransferase [Pseudoalteromonas luteoviolacea]KZN56321.1 aminotransferase [Pseudoalteromonas luteoviolacea H33]KZN77027.1 aminotransferase [Pseudoalteromonas luteoviolacea H33-S]MBQ4879250.1 aminotransferase class I/II-fold pyridoxal phosphate-dependent enzyme [Pseudoalteromonas luteoviolacea]MBQ4908310.1 aminotransferase class I/II-fold pyridoxal phosphate-dependent enzyme [Pseudoalteromonas luteoviolacea]
MESKLPDVGTSIFSTMTGLANEHGALNLSQGFPEFDTPSQLKHALSAHTLAGYNQYAPSPGLPVLQQEIAALVARRYQQDIDAAAQVTVTAGATEALFVAIQALVRKGDEVIVFDPAYDSYRPAVELAGGRTVHIPLCAPDYAIDWTQVSAAVTQKTRAIIINSPHNPSAKTLKQADLDALKALLNKHDIYLISDEVYEHITFDGAPHLSVLRDSELAARAFVVSSFGKTFHCTGWKMGYCIAPANLTVEFRKIHQFVNFSSFTPAQLALADMLRDAPEHVDELGLFYQQKRDVLVEALAISRFKILPSEGTYFLLLDYSDISDVDDVTFCQQLVEQIGVAAIPLSVFYDKPNGDKIIRLCFAKETETLIAAAEKLCQL